MPNHKKMKDFADERERNVPHKYLHSEAKKRSAPVLPIGYLLDQYLWDSEAWGQTLVNDLHLLFRAVAELERHVGINIEGTGVSGWDACRNKWTRPAPGDDPPPAPGCG